MYRFRTIENLLGERRELENQEIYFSDIESLNDPMEGFREVYWSGDVIAWKNLFKHYILCLEHMCALAYFDMKGTPFSSVNVPVYRSEDNLPTDRYRQIFNEICDKFFKNSDMNKYIEIIASLPWKVSRDELYSFLRSIHSMAYQSIMEVYLKYGYIKARENEPPDYLNHLEKFVEAMDSVNLADKENQESIRSVLDFQRKVFLEFDLFRACELYGSAISQRRWFILSGFTSAYLNRIESLIYPAAYVACFMEDCTNAAVWSHYGDSHKGVCLKFRTGNKNGAHTIGLKGITGWGSKPIYGFRELEFHKMDYTNQFPSTNFFTSIGRLTIGQLMKQWYSDEAGNISKCAAHIKDDDAEGEWRKQYWDNYDSCFFVKLKDWEYEKEWRLLLSSVLDTFEDANDRKRKYKFEDLEAIIFGMRTSVEDKVKIIKLIEKKCKENNRENFDFYQAYYSKQKGRMVIEEPGGRFSRSLFGSDRENR